MNNIPKLVFSRTLQHADWPDSRIAAGENSEVIAQLKRESAGGDLIVWGVRPLPGPWPVKDLWTSTVSSANPSPWETLFRSSASSRCPSPSG